jgi:hypothetical protein
LKLHGLVLGTRERIAGAIYGTIVVLAALTAGATAYEHDLWRLGAIVSASVLVLWVAHVYAHGVGESLTLGRRLTGAELQAIAGRELSIALAAVLPLAAVALGALGVIEGGRPSGSRSGSVSPRSGCKECATPDSSGSARSARWSPSASTSASG